MTCSISGYEMVKEKPTASTLLSHEWVLMCVDNRIKRNHHVFDKFRCITILILRVICKYCGMW